MWILCSNKAFCYQSRKVCHYTQLIIPTHASSQFWINPTAQIVFWSKICCTPFKSQLNTSSSYRPILLGAIWNIICIYVCTCICISVDIYKYIYIFIYIYTWSFVSPKIVTVFWHQLIGIGPVKTVSMVRLKVISKGFTRILHGWNLLNNLFNKSNINFYKAL